MANEDMTYEEFITEYLELVRELPDDPEDSIYITGFLNETMAMHDFHIPMEELMVVLKHLRPTMAGYLELIGNREFKQLFKSGMTLEEALRRLGKSEYYFEQPPQK